MVIARNHVLRSALILACCVGSLTGGDGKYKVCPLCCLPATGEYNESIDLFHIGYVGPGHRPMWNLSPRIKCPLSRRIEPPQPFGSRLPYPRSRDEPIRYRAEVMGPTHHRNRVPHGGERLVYGNAAGDFRETAEPGVGFNSRTVRRQYGAWSPAALSKGGSPSAIGVMCISVIFIGAKSRCAQSL